MSTKENKTEKLARMAAESGRYLESDAAQAYADLLDRRGINFDEFEDLFINCFE